MIIIRRYGIRMKDDAVIAELKLRHEVYFVDKRYAIVQQDSLRIDGAENRKRANKQNKQTNKQSKRETRLKIKKEEEEKE
jgi:hypothetical protein